MQSVDSEAGDSPLHLLTAVDVTEGMCCSDVVCDKSVPDLANAQLLQVTSYDVLDPSR